MKKTAKEKALENIEKTHNKYKDHEIVEAAEKKWKSKSKMAQLVFVLAAVLIGYNVLFGGSM